MRTTERDTTGLISAKVFINLDGTMGFMGPVLATCQRTATGQYLIRFPTFRQITNAQATCHNSSVSIAAQISGTTIAVYTNASSTNAANDAYFDLTVTGR